MIEEELSLLPRWCPDAQLPQPLAWYTGKIINTLPMKHRIGGRKVLNVRGRVSMANRRSLVHSSLLRRQCVPTQPQEGSLEQFITEHYWGYSALQTGGCVRISRLACPLGKCGRPLKPDLKVKPALFMAL